MSKPVPAPIVRGVRTRDQFTCAALGPGCTRFTELTTQHRINRGMGGSKRLDVFPNLLTLCARCNTRLESDAVFAQLGRERGWKLSSWEDPLRVAVWFAWNCQWRLLDADGDWVLAAGRGPVEVLDPAVVAAMGGAS